MQMDLDLLTDVAPLSWISIGTTLLCGAIVGLERQLRGKPVGVRTGALITLGTYVFVATAMSLDSNSMDPSRVVGQVVTGIGFLGAGVMLSKDGVVVGVTSAATIWTLAGIGTCVAIGSELTAIKLALVVVFVLWGMEVLETYSSALTRGAHARLLTTFKQKTKK